MYLIELWCFVLGFRAENPPHRIAPIRYLAISFLKLLPYSLNVLALPNCVNLAPPFILGACAVGMYTKKACTHSLIDHWLNISLIACFIASSHSFAENWDLNSCNSFIG